MDKIITLEVTEQELDTLSDAIIHLVKKELEEWFADGSKDFPLSDGKLEKLHEKIIEKRLK